jgi:hypothetical protein
MVFAGLEGAALKPRHYIQIFTIPNFKACSRESALTYQRNHEREEFFLLLTLTKHFLHFF